MPERILIASDDNLLGAMVGALLTSSGYEIELVNTGDEAQQRLAAYPFDALILDIALRHQNCLDLTRWVRGQSALRNLPVIVLSPMATRDDDVPSVLHAGADEALAVPFRHQELILKLRRMLERQRWAIERQQMVANLSAVADGIERFIRPTGEQSLPEFSDLADLEEQAKWQDVMSSLSTAIQSLQDASNNEETQILRRALEQISLALKRAGRYVQVRTQAQSLRDANEKLRELERLRAEFTNAIVHDIRSPLGTIVSTMELIEQELSGPRPKKSDILPLVTGARAVAEKLIALVSELLDFSKLEAGKMNLALERLEVAKVIEQVGEEFEPAIRRKSIKFSYGCEDHLPAIVGDAGKLHRALSNLMSNAVKFTPDGGQIWLEARLMEGTQVDAGVPYIVFSVVDSGEGIPAQDLPYLFDAYYQAASRSRDLGTGLGLAIVKRIAAAHGGNVSVRSQVGVGTAFSIVLPLAPPADGQPATAPPPLPAAAPGVVTDLSEVLATPANNSLPTLSSPN
ncbi:response regulator [Chloracidobacterium validum]|uniref:histidine kinase n=1 Tax=Chloracidobacterium validum TaxID=2821543 RepID=A0ABX8B9Z6_9BACT|nr:ATP-binding protein [Chloracidobacterium validum]QUW02489.1 response regulator [Chloracidobacterium validum]